MLLASVTIMPMNRYLGGRVGEQAKQFLAWSLEHGVFRKGQVQMRHGPGIRGLLSTFDQL